MSVVEKSGLDVIGRGEHKAFTAQAADAGVTLVKDTQKLLPIDPAQKKNALLIYAQSTPNSKAYQGDGMRALITEERRATGIFGEASILFNSIIANVNALLAEVDCSLSDVAQTNVYLTDIRDLQAFNEVYARYFTPPAPARSVVAVSALPMGALVEMDCVACR